ncbi:hypothetical protein NE865_03894 [Phthorimaea operculella]|nr:hypothetical protein NE865_03894 [Phthorimaea operculella]
MFGGTSQVKSCPQINDPDDVPTYVARDLNKLPPVTFDHVDVTTLLKDIVLLKSDVKELKGKWDTAEQVCAELRRELTALRVQNAASATPLAACVNMQRGVAVQHETAPVSDSKRPATLQQPGKLRVSDPTADRKSDNNTLPPPPSRPEPALHPDAAPFVPGRQKEVLLQKTRRPRRKQQPVPPVTQKGMQKASPAAKENNVASKAIVDEEGFTLAESRKRRLRRNRNKRGTVSAASTTLKAAEPIAQLYVSRLDSKTTPEDILQHLQKMVKVNQDPVRTPAGLTLGIRQLESIIKTNFRSFVLTVPRKYVCGFMQEDVWPQGVVFRRYRPPVQHVSMSPKIEKYWKPSGENANVTHPAKTHLTTPHMSKSAQLFGLYG